MYAPATIIVLLVTALATFYAFRRPDTKERWMFNPQAILVHKEFYRMLTPGFIHADWRHFAFNAYSFLSFAQVIEVMYGAKTMLIVYFSSIIGGSLLSLLIHRHHDYRALGASGGVCGVIFAYIFLVPGGGVSPLLLPIYIPAYLYAIIFLVVSYISHRRGIGNIGHDAHLGGAIVGLLVAAAMYPELIFAQPWMFAGVLLLSLAIMGMLLRDPLQLVRLPFEERMPEPAGGERLRRYRENSVRNKKMATLDEFLEKVAKDGIDSLSASQRKQMEQLSQELYGRSRTADSNAAKNDK